MVGDMSINRYTGNLQVYAFALSLGLIALNVISTLNYIQRVLVNVGPVLSAVLFILAGVFYAIGQLFPSTKRANFHSAAIDIIVGAIVVAVLSVASTSLAVASTQLLTNVTANTV